MGFKVVTTCDLPDHEHKRKPPSMDPAWEGRHPAFGFRVTLEAIDGTALTEKTIIDVCEPEARRHLQPLMELMERYGRMAPRTATNGRRVPNGEDSLGTNGAEVLRPMTVEQPPEPVVPAIEPPRAAVRRLSDGKVGCPFCPVIKRAISGLRSHCRDEHSDRLGELKGTELGYKRVPKPARCPLCNLQKAGYQGLLSHLRSPAHHADVAALNLRPCPQCDKVFTANTPDQADARVRGHLASHRRKADAPTEAAVAS